ncbi:hypothetical protein [Hymenobacter lucidus]|uniref:Uncharacterized protein n=1 Tax=Hymenobacter lucidus TaxID=2880930 RepID=A0ABS8ASN4_9BACT|nr:hypothetical protein [Hymenobacter lucidus]MCB2409230.1 hypothetical protein [Hymenobacter lucidus]
MPDSLEIQRLREELTRAQLEKEIATERSAAADSEKKARAAFAEAYKGPAITAPTGAATPGDVPFMETQVLANATLRATLNQFIQRLQAKVSNDISKGNQAAKPLGSPVKLVLINPANLPALELYASATTQLALLKTDYTQAVAAAQALLNPGQPARAMAATASLMAPAVLGGAAAGMVRTAADLVSLFLTTTTFKNTVFPENEMLLVATFTHLLHTAEPQWRVIAPAAFPPGLLTDTKDSAFFIMLDAIAATHKTGQAILPILQNKLLSLPIPTAPDSPEQLQLDHYNSLIAKLTALQQAYSQLQTLLVSAAAPTQSILQAERLAAEYQGTNTYLLKLQANSKGSTRGTHSLWRNDQLNFSAGTELSYLVFGQAGEIILAGSLCSYTDYLSTEDIAKNNWSPKLAHGK